MAYLQGMMPLQAVRKPPYTVEAPGYDKVEGETIPRRHPKAKDGLITTPAEGLHTVYDIIGRSAGKHGDRNALGTRKLVQMHKETKKIKKVVDGEVQEVDKEWQYFELSKYSFLTYKQLQTRVLQLGAGLRKLGLNPGDKLHLFATTR